MEHYAERGWICISSDSKFMDSKYYKEWNITSVSYNDKFYYTSDSTCPGGDHKSEGFTIIPFSSFASEVGITVPVFVMTSEDGSPLYEGDKCWVPQVNMQDEFKGFSLEMSVIIGWKNYSGKAKFFSTEEAARKWIKEQMKPKSITVELYYGGSVEISSNHIYLNNAIRFSPSDLEDMLHAYKSQQC